MSTKTPPIPPGNRSTKGPGGADHQAARATPAPGRGNPDKQGQAGNSKVNTTHQGHQQDR